MRRDLDVPAFGFDADPGMAISTVSLPDRQKFPFYREAVCETFVGIRPTHIREDVFDATFRKFSFGDGSVGRVYSTGHLAERSKHDIARIPDASLYLNMQISGFGEYRQNNNSVTATPGKITLLDSEEPFQIDFSESPFVELISFKIPKAQFNAHEDAVARLTATDIASELRAAGVLENYLSNLLQIIPAQNENQNAHLFGSLANLLAVILDGAKDIGRTPPGADGTLRLEAILTYIGNNLSEPNLSASLVAEKLGYSPRYVHQVFEQTDWTVGAWIREQRLHACLRDLRNTKMRDVRISSIALSWGFSDISYFGKCFKNRFGISPREARDQSMKSA